MPHIVKERKRFFNLYAKEFLDREMLTIFLLKILTAFLSFLILRYIYLRIDKEYFGVYQTLYVGISWAGFINFGLGNGVRNVVAKNVENTRKIARYCEQALGIAIVILLASSVLYTCLSLSFNVGHFFEGEHLEYRLVRKAVNIFFAVVLVSMLTSLIKAVLLGIQKNIQSVFIEFTIQLSYLVSLVIYTHVTGENCNIYQLASLFLGANGMVYIVSQIYIAKKVKMNFKNIFRPERKLIKEFFGLGMRFFVLQIATLILYATDEFIIARYLGARYVADYAITKKVFWISTFLFASASVPLWSRLTHLKEAGFHDKIVLLIRKYFVIFLLVSLAALVLLASFQWIVRIWLGPDNYIDTTLALYFFIYVLLYNWSSYVASISNGLEIIKYQLIAAVIGAVSNIPLSIYLGVHLGLGVKGILIATILSMVLSGILIPFELVKKWSKIGYKQ